MKINFIYCLLISFYLVSCNNKSNAFTIEGEIAGLADSTELVLSYFALDNDRWTQVNETAHSTGGKFTLRGNINELTAAYLSFDFISIRLYLEPEAMRLKIDRDRPWEYKLSGTKTESENKRLRKKLKPHEEEQYKELCSSYNIIEQINTYNEWTPQVDSLWNIYGISRTKRDDIGRKIDKIRLDYIRENKARMIAPDLIYMMARWELIGIDTIKNAYDALPPESKMTMPGKLAYKQIEQTERLVNARNITEGAVAPDFSGTNISGKTVRLYDFYGRNYVLLDFWASWCKPCLEQVPQVKNIYCNYADKGLTIIGMSLDEDEGQWIHAVNKYKLDIWPQVLCSRDSDNDYFAVDISDVFGVESIPEYFLIDREGKVVARWKHIGEEQRVFIDNLFHQQ